MERRLGRALQRVEQPFGPATQEIHGPRGAADAAAPGGPRPRPSHSAARDQTPASHTATGGVGGGDSGSSGHLPSGRAGPGRADSMLSSERTSELTGPSIGERDRGRVRTKWGWEERRSPPRPRPFLGPHGRHHAAPRGKAAARARARTGDFSHPLPSPIN